MKVSVAACNDYDQSTVYEAVERLLEPLGGMGSFVKPGMRVYIKPNMLTRAQPSAMVTTHPEVIGAVARLALQAGAAEVMIGDCPGGGRNHSSEEVLRDYRVCGFEEVANREGARLVVNRKKSVREVPDGRAAKSFKLVEEMMGADLLINVCKAKTHALCTMTGATKNLYGTIYGLDKGKYHAIYNRPSSFNHFLIDIAETVKPRLNIMDAIVGMEGPGPSAGYPRKLGALLASASPYALDAVAVRLMGWKQSDVLLLKLARERGLLPEKLEEIETAGDSVEELAGRMGRPFLKPTMTGQVTGLLGNLLPKGLRGALQAHPVVDGAKCVGCGECAAACPPHAIQMSGRKPDINYELCIRCFCCQELCPAKAMEAKKGLLHAGK